MLARLNGRHGRYSVYMVRCSHHHRIDVFLLIEHLPEIPISFGLRIFPECPRGVIPIHITECHYVFSFHVFKVCRTHTAHAYAGDVQFVTRGCMAWPSKHMTDYNGER